MRSRKQRKNLAPIAAVVAAAALAVPAFASGAIYTGTLKSGGTMSFQTTNRHGKIAGVKSFSMKNVPTTCDQGAYGYSGTLPFSIAVKSRAFSITTTGGAVIQQVSGLFTNQRRKATGSLNIYGTLAPGHSNCSTGKLSWSATRR